jgi:hypothetical protein
MYGGTVLERLTELDLASLVRQASPGSVLSTGGIARHTRSEPLWERYLPPEAHWNVVVNKSEDIREIVEREVCV